MKKVILLLLIYSFNKSFGQGNVVNLIIDDRANIEKKEGGPGGVYECRISKSKNGISDYFTFLINCDENKSFEDNGIEFIPNKSKLISMDRLLKKSACEIHEFLSLKTIYLIKKDPKTAKMKMWIGLYTGTVKNTIVSRQKNKI